MRSMFSRMMHPLCTVKFPEHSFQPGRIDMLCPGFSFGIKGELFMEREKHADKQALPHSLSLQDRKKMAVSGVNEVVNFDENQVTVATTMGTLVIRGSSLHVDQLSLESGELRLTGQIDMVEYDDSVAVGGFLRRLFQ